MGTPRYCLKIYIHFTQTPRSTFRYPRSREGAHNLLKLSLVVFTSWPAVTDTELGSDNEAEAALSPTKDELKVGTSESFLTILFGNIYEIYSSVADELP